MLNTDFLLILLKKVNLNNPLVHKVCNYGLCSKWLIGGLLKNIFIIVLLKTGLIIQRDDF